MNIVLRPAVADDCALIDQAVATWARAHSVPQVGANYATWLMENADVEIAGVADRPVAFFATKGASIQALLVLPAFGGQGVGAAIITTLQRRMRALSVWVLAMNVNALVFYERHGFSIAEQTATAKNEFDLPDLKLNWRRADGQA